MPSAINRIIFLAFLSTETSSFGSSALPSGRFFMKASLSAIEPSGIGMLAINQG